MAATARVQSIGFGKDLARADRAAKNSPGDGLVNRADCSFHIANGASSIQQPVAPDSWISLQGSRLAAEIATAGGVTLTRQLAGTEVTVTDECGYSAPAELLYVSPTLINCVLPSELSGDYVTITIQRDGEKVSSSVTELSTVSPGIFTLPAATHDIPLAFGTEYSTFERIRSVPVADCSAPESCFLTPMSFGHQTERLVLSLYATGIRHSDDVRARINGMAVRTLSAGAFPIMDGLDKVDLEIPRALAGIGVVPVHLVVNGRDSNVVRIEIR